MNNILAYDASFRLDLDGIRAFTYEASGQVATYDRVGQIYAYSNNNCGRPVLVTKDGVQVAAYTYDDDEQRVVKSLPDGTLVHYTYDSEGRLISETNGNTGDTIREYIWLGLTPIAVFAANDNCDQDRIDELVVLIAGLSAQLNANQAERVSLKTRAARAQTQVDKLQSRMGGIDGRLERRTARLLVMRTRVSGYQSRLKTFNQALDLEIRAAGKYSRRARSLVRRIKKLQRRIANGQAAMAPTKARIKALQQRRHLWAEQQAAEASNLANAQVRLQVLAAEDSGLENQITIYKTELANLQTQCDAGNPTPSLSYLHTDHLGKPQFATDATGAVIWDAGGQVTPFGDGIQLASAFTQNLQFPGQYADEETGLSHNHHRTYDPALGRYLQSDPIGLIGGLNRYAYVGGNPMGWIDPMGLSSGAGVRPIPPGAYIAEAIAMITALAKKPVSKGPGAAFLIGYTIGGIAAAGYYEWQNINAINAANNADCDKPIPIPIPIPITPARVNPNNGNRCDNNNRQRFQDAVQKQCKSVPFSCNGGMSTSQMQTNIGQAQQCLNARQRINNACFGGGDAGHQQAAQQALNAIMRCQRLSGG